MLLLFISNLGMGGTSSTAEEIQGQGKGGFIVNVGRMMTR